ncbi:T9SS type A sorting domain-containing protein [bacterium]|nr:T9SS type A sorting domain-containing protein [bacterium]
MLMKHILLLLLSNFLLCQNIFAQLTVGEVYDFDIGDEFQYSGSNCYNDCIYRKKLVDKRLSPSKDTVYYTWQCADTWYVLKRDSNYNQYLQKHNKFYTSIESYTGLGNEIFHLDSNICDLIYILPEASWNDTIKIPDSILYSKRVYLVDTATAVRNTVGSCNTMSLSVHTFLGILLGATPYIEENYIYAKGLGVLSQNTASPSNSFDCFYYKKVNGESCGRPDLTGVRSLYPEKAFAFYPNPANNQIRLTLPVNNETLHYQIINGTGQQLASGVLNQADNSINTAALPAGFYQLVLHEKSTGYIESQSLIIAR